MSQENILSIRKQKGVKFDVDAVAQELKEARWELFEQHDDPNYKNENIFNLIKGKLKIYDGGWDSSWEISDQLNTWGYSERGFLNALAKHMTAGEVTFNVDREGNRPDFYKVTPGKVEKL